MSGGSYWDRCLSPPWREEARRCAAEVTTRPNAIQDAAHGAWLARIDAIVSSMILLLDEASELLAQERAR